MELWVYNLIITNQNYTFSVNVRWNVKERLRVEKEENEKNSACGKSCPHKA